MMRNVLTSGLLFCLCSALLAQQTTDSPLRRTILGVLNSSLPQVIENYSQRVTLSDVETGELQDAVRIIGQVDSYALREEVLSQARSALSAAFTAGKLPRQYKVEDGLIVAGADTAYLRALQGSLPQIIDRYNERVKLQSAVYHPKTEKLVLVGEVDTEPLKEELLSAAEEIFRSALAAGQIDKVPAKIDAGEFHPRVSIAARLNANLQNVPELEGAWVVLSKNEDGFVQLQGIIAEESQRPRLQQIALTALENEVRAGNFVGPFQRVDASMMIPVPRDASPLLRVRALNRILYRMENSLIRVQRLEGERLSLSGAAPSAFAVRTLERHLQGIFSMEEIDVSSVMLVGVSKGYEPLNTQQFNQGVAMLGNAARASQLLEHTTNMIEANAATPALWYLRAAAHLQLNNVEAAAGDMEIAKGLQRNSFREVSHMFERFQGWPRWQFEQLLRSGELAAVMPLPISPEP